MRTSVKAFLCLATALSAAWPSGDAAAADARFTKKSCIQQLRGFTGQGRPGIAEQVKDYKRRQASGDKTEATDNMLVMLRDLEWNCAKYEGMRDCKPGPLEVINLPPKTISAGDTVVVTLGNEDNGVAAVITFNVTEAGDILKARHDVANRTGDCIVKSEIGYALRRQSGQDAQGPADIGQGAISLEPGQGYGTTTDFPKTGRQDFDIVIGDFRAE